MMSNETIQSIKERRSVRKYINKAIPEETLEELIDCARLAPTGNNKQAWSFVVVTDRQLKEEIASFAQYGKFIKDAGACIAVFVDEDESTTPLQDASAATENIMIAASSHGLGTCWVSSYKRDHSQKVKELLNCPDNMELITIMSVGYFQQKDVNMPEKKTLEDVIKWNQF